MLTRPKYEEETKVPGAWRFSKPTKVTKGGSAELKKKVRSGHSTAPLVACKNNSVLILYNSLI